MPDRLRRKLIITKDFENKNTARILLLTGLPFFRVTKKVENNRS